MTFLIVFAGIFLLFLLIYIVGAISQWIANCKEEEAKVTAYYESYMNIRKSDMYKKIISDVCQQLQAQIDHARSTPIESEKADRFFLHITSKAVTIYRDCLGERDIYIDPDDSHYSVYWRYFLAYTAATYCIDFMSEGYSELVCRKSVNLDPIALLVDILKKDVALKYNLSAISCREEYSNGAAIIMWDLTRYHPVKENVLKNWY